MNNNGNGTNNNNNDVDNDGGAAGGFECSIEHFTRAICGDPKNVGFDQVAVDNNGNNGNNMNDDEMRMMMDMAAQRDDDASAMSNGTRGSMGSRGSRASRVSNVREGAPSNASNSNHSGRSSTGSSRPSSPLGMFWRRGKNNDNDNNNNPEMDVNQYNNNKQKQDMMMMMMNGNGGLQDVDLNGNNAQQQQQRQGSKPNLFVDTNVDGAGPNSHSLEFDHEYRVLTEQAMVELNENRDFAQAAGLVFNPRNGGDIQSGITPRYQRNQFDIFFDVNPNLIGNNNRQGMVPDGVEMEDNNGENNEHCQEEEERENDMRTFASQLSPRWGGRGVVASSLARRLRDFQFARIKRKQKYGESATTPWGIVGLYDHLAGIRLDVEWAEDAAWRRVHNKPYLSWADFEVKKRSGRNQPFFTYSLLLVCSIMLIASIGANGWVVDSVTANPMIGPSAETLIDMGAKESNLIVNEGQGFRLLAPMILHAGFIHYMVNMLALWFIGSAVERIHGYAAASIIFVISSLGGTIMSAVFLPEFVSVGASGGIFGLIGACLADIFMNWNMLFSTYLNDGQQKLKHWSVIAWLTFDIFINCIIGLTPFVDNFTHMGGMLIGFLCGLSTMERLNREFFGMEYGCAAKSKHIATRFFGLILSVLLIIIFSIVLLEGDGTTSPCTSCRYASCVPFPPWADDANKWWYCDDCERVTGSAQRNTQTGMYEAIQIACPDGESITINLEEDAVTNSKSLLEDDLPHYCRDYCDEVYAR